MTRVDPLFKVQNDFQKKIFESVLLGHIDSIAISLDKSV